MGPDDEARAALAANEAFYRAFNDRDGAAMDALWAERATVTCVHPGWRVVRDRAAVLASWRAIFSGASPRVAADGARATVVGEVAVVVCYEHLSGPSGARGGTLIATNVFAREGAAWRLVHHHSGPVSAAPEVDLPATPAPSPKRPLN